MCSTPTRNPNNVIMCKINDNIVQKCCSLIQIGKWRMDHVGCNKIMDSAHIENLNLECRYCPECNEECESIDYYFKHQELVHFGFRPFMCTQCRNIYGTKMTFYNHVFEKHRGGRILKNHIHQTHSRF